MLAGMNLGGQRAIVTGANTGLGFRTASALAGGGARVTLAVRNPDKGAEAAARIRKSHPGAVVQVSTIDLADLATVREFAAREAADPVDILVNNAGVMLVPERGTTADGFELHLGINHLGHFALTCLLLPALPPDARVVHVSSLAHHSARRMDRGLSLIGPYAPMAAYAQSKLAVLLFAFELDRRLRAAGSRIVSVAAHPGWSATELFDRGDRPGPFVRMSRWATQQLGSSPVNGARSQVYAATAPDVTGGQFFGPRMLAWGPPAPARASKAARDLAEAQWLWRTSEWLSEVEAGLPVVTGQ